MAKAQAYYFEAPYQVAPPILTDEAVGIDRVLLRAKQGSQTSITIYDTPDKRLLRAGVRLMNRQHDGLSEWVLQADGWEPWLASELVLDENDGEDLPTELAELTLPFRRRATLGPVASWASEQSKYQLLDVDGQPLAEMIDDRISLSQGGPISERARQITLLPKAAMTSAQRAFVIDRLTAIGADRVEHYQSRDDRLAEIVPETELNGPAPRGSKASLEDFLRWILAQQLRKFLLDSFAVEKELAGDPGIIIDDFSRLQRDLRALTGLLEQSWAQELDWHLGQAIDAQERSTIRDRAIDVMDLLATGVRAPRVDGDPQRSARDELRDRLNAQLAAWLLQVDQLSPESPDDAWTNALAALDGLLALLEVADPILRKTKKWQRYLVAAAARLQQSVSTVAMPSEQQIAELTVAEAFEAGRQFQRDIAEVLRTRTKFVNAWPRIRTEIVSSAPDAKLLRFALSSPSQSSSDQPALQAADEPQSQDAQ